MSPENMNLSVNGNSKVPPGFRFHPTEEELLHYYLTKKVASQKIDLDVIKDVDLNKLEPWDIQEMCRIGSTPQNDWYFFSHKDKKYPTGTRTNRATAAGFWKATGRDKVIHSNLRRIGMRKTLVFYKGRAPHGQKSDWIMHEYRLDDTNIHDPTNVSNILGDSGPEEGWVVCRVFKKKNYHKALESPLNSSTTSILPRNDGGVLDHILTYMGRSSSSSCKQEHDSNIHFPDQSPGFMHLPALDHNTSTTININPTSSPSSKMNGQDLVMEIGASSDWAAMDRLVASQLNGGQQYSDGQIFSYGEAMNDEDFAFPFDDHDDLQLMNMHDHDHNSDHRPNDHQHHHHDHHYDHQVSSTSETGLWDFARSSSSLSSSSSDPLCHLSV